MAKKNQTELGGETEMFLSDAPQNKSTSGKSIFGNMKIVLPVFAVIVVLLVTVIIVQAVGVTAFPNNDPRGSISVVVTDQNNNPIKGAKVTVLADGSNANTDGSGYALIRNMQVGSYTLRLSKSGYATMDATATVALAPVTATTLTTDTYVAAAVTVKSAMRKNSATVSGYATIGNIMADAINHQRLGEAELTLNITTAGIVNTRYTTTTAADGAYKFENLPEGATYTISGVAKSGVIYYSGAKSGTTEWSYATPGFVAESDKEMQFTTIQAGQFAVATSSRIEQAATSTLSIDFTSPLMQLDQIAGGYITATSGGKAILFTIARPSSQRLTLTLAAPAGSRSWYAEGATEATITLTANIKSETGVALPATTITLVKPVEAITPAEATGLASNGTLKSATVPAEGTAESLNFEWTYVEGLTYIVYVMNEDGTWKNLNLTAAKYEYDNGLEGQDRVVMNTVWRVSLVGALGTKEELRALDTTTTYRLAVVSVKNGAQGLTYPQTTVTLTR